MTIENDCDFSGVTGDVSWVHLASTVDPSAGSNYEVTFAEDQSGDIDQTWRADIQNDRPALKRFNDSYFNYETRSNVADDNVLVFVPSVPQGLLTIMANGSVNDSSVVFFNAGAGGPETALVGGSNTDVTTGVLTGTTGANTRVTFSADGSGNLYIENRTGGSLVFFPTIQVPYDQL